MTVTAVVVTYHPSANVERLLTRAGQAGFGTLVIDNASPTTPDLQAALTASQRHLILPSNEGVSGALARALRVISPSSAWLLTLDQDSDLSVAAMRELYRVAINQPDNCAIVAPQVSNIAGHAASQRVSKFDPVSVDRVITSGSMCRVSALRAVDAFNDGYFIDFVDFALCFRLRRAGFRIVIAPGALMRHSIGNAKRHRIPLSGGRTITTTNHPPVRLYYRYRNFLLLLRDGALRSDGLWSLKTGISLAIGVFKILAFEQQKIEKGRAIFHGIRDGIAGRRGRANDPKSTADGNL